MSDLGLTTSAVDLDSVVVGYNCPCGCTPAVTYQRGAQAIKEGCCCGNEMAVGPDALHQIMARNGFAVRTVTVATPWQEQLPVVWAIGPSRHPGVESHAEDPIDSSMESGHATDPVCGMNVDVAAALARDLTAIYLGIEYHFCGKGCKLDFLDDPSQYLAPGYVPSM